MRRKKMTNKDMFKGTTYNSLEEQVGGKHYRNMKIQPAEFINENKQKEYKDYEKEKKNDK